MSVPTMPAAHPEAATVSGPIGVMFEVEILRCVDTDRIELISTFGDRRYEVSTAEEARAAITAARACLDQAAATVDHYEAMTVARGESTL